MCKRLKHSCANESHLFIPFLFKAFSIGGNERLQTHFHVLSFSNKKIKTQIHHLQSANLYWENKPYSSLPVASGRTLIAHWCESSFVPHQDSYPHQKCPHFNYVTMSEWPPLVTDWSLYFAQYLEGDLNQGINRNIAASSPLNSASRNNGLFRYCSVVAPVFSTLSPVYCGIRRSVQSSPHTTYI